jgi:hypothetical protein
MKDKDGNEIPGSAPGEGAGQEPPKPPTTEELTKQMADLIAAQKKQTADLEIMREENMRLQSLLVSMRDHPGDPSSDSRRPMPRGAGRFSDPAARSEFEKKYSLPVEAAEEIIEESVSRFTRAQQEREEAIRNGESLKKDFFSKYPDLNDYVPIVKHFADQCAAEHPDWTVTQGFVEVAKLSREYIKSKLGAPSGREEPPPIVPAGGSSRSEGDGAGRLPGSPETPASIPTQDEEIRIEMESRRGTRSKAL